MHKFRTYLTNVTALAKSGKLNTAGISSLKIVIGNTSCDMDSAVGALCLGYYYTVTTGELFVPVLNCNSDDFYCKMEIV